MAINISKMDIDGLLELRARVDKALSEQQRVLQKQLQRLGFTDKGVLNGGKPSRGSSLKGRKVIVKYRHPKTGETYAGRGAMAGWLKAELKAGKKLEDFLVDKSKAKTARKGSVRKKRRKAKR